MAYGKYSKVFCKIEAEGRQSSPSFGSDSFIMEIYVGSSIKAARLLATIEVTPDIDGEFESTSAKLIINGKEINL